MGLPNVFQTGQSGMVAAKAAMATAGHNIANSTTEGFSRQRVKTENGTPNPGPGNHFIGTGTQISRVERVNDEYVEKQIRNAGKDLAFMEEKDLMLRQTEDIFNEMNGDGLNRLISRFYNEFRKLANEPESDAVRMSVREATQSMINDFHRLRNEIDGVRRHIDSRIEGYSREVNSFAEQVKDLNIRIKQQEVSGAVPNDLLDQRDTALKKLGSFMDLNMHKSEDGSFSVDIRGIGPLVTGPNVEKFFADRTSADDQGKVENALSLKTTASAQSDVTHMLKGGKLGALLEVRDSVLSKVQTRLDELAYTIATAVNTVHQQGYNAEGQPGVSFFKNLTSVDRAAEFLSLSDEIQQSVGNIATAAQPDAPGDNRIALAISSLQGQRLMDDGRVTMDDWYNSIVSDVGVVTSQNRVGMNQQNDIMIQLGKMREQISGVSVDEETANLMQFQQIFGASARIIQIADECLKTVLDLRR